MNQIKASRTSTMILACVYLCLVNQAILYAQQTGDGSRQPMQVTRPGLFPPLTEPPCSYCIEQEQKDLVQRHDVVLAWIRGAHNGGAMPLRHFISATRVVNDTYGLFFYDPDAGYVAAYKKDYGYSFYGWRGGVMLVQGKDGTIWSALSGRAIEGPLKGERLERTPNVITTWGHWLLLHPESTAYDLYDGQKYEMAELPTERNLDSLGTIGPVNDRLERDAMVLGVEGQNEQLAVSLEGLESRDCRMAEIDGRSVVVFWYAPTNSAVCFDAELNGKKLTFYADQISPLTAPFKDRETGTRWTLAGRGIDGPLRGEELNWHPSIACRWYAWSYEYPETKLISKPASASQETLKSPEPVPFHFPRQSNTDRGIVVTADQVVESSLIDWKKLNYSVVLLLKTNGDLIRNAEAADKILKAKLPLDYFIEVARCTELAISRPDLMASVQGHKGWREHFHDFPKEGANEVVKVSPWVPIFYQEAYDLQLARIESLLQGLPAARRIWLNDLQGAPSACGCGHPLCRWTVDYGPKKTAERRGDNSAAQFVSDLSKRVPNSKVVPIFVSECEKEDKDTVCCGVACYTGKCWEHFTLQIDALAHVAPEVGVACFFRTFDRDLKRYGKSGSWVNRAIELFSEMPSQRKGTGLQPDRLIAVLQGWDVSPEEIDTQIAAAESAGVKGWLLVTTPIEQSWVPKIYNTETKSIIEE